MATRYEYRATRSRAVWVEDEWKIISSGPLTKPYIEDLLRLWGADAALAGRDTPFKIAEQPNGRDRAEVDIELVSLSDVALAAVDEVASIDASVTVTEVPQPVTPADTPISHTFRLPDVPGFVAVWTQGISKVLVFDEHVAPASIDRTITGEFHQVPLEEGHVSVEYVAKVARSALRTVKAWAERQ